MSINPYTLTHFDKETWIVNTFFPPCRLTHTHIYVCLCLCSQGNVKYKMKINYQQSDKRVMRTYIFINVHQKIQISSKYTYFIYSTQCFMFHINVSVFHISYRRLNVSPSSIGGDKKMQLHVEFFFFHAATHDAFF